MTGKAGASAEKELFSVLRIRLGDGMSRGRYIGFPKAGLGEKEVIHGIATTAANLVARYYYLSSLYGTTVEWKKFPITHAYCHRGFFHAIYKSLRWFGAAVVGEVEGSRQIDIKAEKFSLGIALIIVVSADVRGTCQRVWNVSKGIVTISINKGAPLQNPRR